MFRMATRLRPLLLLLALLIPNAAVPQDSTPVRRARTVLEQGSTDGEPDTRREVAVALGVPLKRDPITHLLEKLATDKDHLVREAAMLSISELRDPQLTKLALAALDDPVPEVAFAAAQTLFKLNNPEGKQLLIEIVQKESRAKSSFVRAKLRDVVRRMKRPKSAMLFVAQQGAGLVPLPGFGAGLAAMDALVGDPDFSARATALLLIAADRSPEVRSEIEQAFNDPDWSMRAAAAQI